MRDASYMDTLDALARIRDVCQGELSLPQLCVVGDQSSGKSSLPRDGIVRAKRRGRRLYRRLARTSPSADTRQRIERVHVAGVPHRKGASVAIVAQLANRDTDDREMDRLKFLRDLAAAKV